MSRRVRHALVVAAVALLLAAVPAVAHVEVSSPDPQRGDVVLTVPNESAAADVVRLTVRLPDNAIQVEVPPTPGWRARTTTVALAGRPSGSTAGPASTRISEVTWTGGRLGPGEEGRFRLRVGVLEGTRRAGLAFPAVQRYSDGTVARWIGPPGSDTPAAILAAPLPVVAVAPATAPATGTTTTTTTTSGPADPGDASLGLLLGIVGGAALLGLITMGVVYSRRDREP